MPLLETATLNYSPSFKSSI